MTGDPRTYDYSQPTRLCDIVMKGGITSGVVYPHAVCELARTYRFVSVGGTSAGAIAAAAAAAAEHGRERGGFAQLAALPDWVGRARTSSGSSNRSRGRGVFPGIPAAAGHAGPGKWLRVGAALFRSFPLASLVGVVPGLALVVLAHRRRATALLAVAAIVAGLVLALLGRRARRSASCSSAAFAAALPANGFGLCCGALVRRRGAPAP